MIFSDSVSRRRGGTLALLAWCCAWAWSPATAATIPNLAQTDQYFFDTFDLASGLPGVSVVAVCQTHDGYLWVATGGGLARFDGMRFVSFRPPNTPALLTPLIYCLLEDADGSLWIGTGRGLLRRRGQAFERVGLDESEVHTLARDRTGRVWIGTYGEGLFVWENGRLRHCTDDALAGRRYILRLFVDTQDRLWVGSDLPGAVCFEHDSFRRYESGGAVLNDRVESIAEQPRGTLWFGTRGAGLFRLRDGVFAQLGRADGLVTPEVFDLQPAGDGGLWVVTSKLQKLAAPERPRITTIPDVPRDNIFSVYEDREGSVWLSAKERGLVRAGQMPYRLITARDGLPDESVRSIAQDTAGNLWLAGQTHGVARLAADGTATLLAESGESPPRPSVVLAARDGALWMGFAGPLRVRRGAVEKTFGQVRGVYGLYEDRYGTIWMGTVDQGILCYRDGSFTPVLSPAGQMISHATWFCEGPDGAVYAATWSSGLVRVKAGVVTLYQRSNGLPTDEVRAVHVDSDNRVWLGFRGRGLGLWQDGRCWNPDDLSQAFADHVSAIVEDARGRLWLGTPAGVRWIAKADLLAAMRGEKHVAELHIAQVNPSLRSASVWSGSQSIVCTTRDRKLLFATRDGLLVIDPERFPQSSPPPPVYLERVQVDGREVDPAGGVSLAAGVKNFVLDYTAPSFVQPGQVFFKYKLEGYDPDWIEAKTRRTAYYSNLPPGTYSFAVTACNAAGVWNTGGARLAVTQRPHFYQTDWFFALAIAALAAAGYGVNRWSHHRLKLRLERLEAKQAMEKERRRIAKNLHDDLGANLTEIGLFADAMHHKVASPELARDMTALSERVRALAGTLDAIVWSANPANDSLDRLSTFVCGLFQDLCGMASIRCRIDQPEPLPPAALSPDARSNLFLAAREAMTNLVKHSGASEAWLRLKMDGPVFQLTLEDNGRGFDLAAAEAGDRNGLANLRSRLAELKGELRLDSTPGRGTTIVMRVPLEHHPAPPL